MHNQSINKSSKVIQIKGNMIKKDILHFLYSNFYSEKHFAYTCILILDSLIDVINSQCSIFPYSKPPCKSLKLDERL